ncbi:MULTISPECIES: endonuclease/exonuclease/phosphatase family protein [unclassified Streptomyces]|uniref:endonuclease/exonuclease/phosphatase family protein n=1 Tax=unclassified Streptomyces TaxID=2593676 RepID=UPI0003A52AFB|nr:MULTISPECIES: endonuclease/exonuclease/phosphatase family protein [unclassified Streptomyces]MYY02582.1 endonuclease/exonuclease/phosphatase family protein [Streptomyces sp. SID4913]
MVKQAVSGAAGVVGSAFSRRAWDRPGRWRRGRVLAALAALTALLLVAHRAVPNTPGHLGSLLEAFLPWLGLAVVPLLTLAVLRRSLVALSALLLPVTAWAYAFGGLLLPAPDPGARDLVVVQHNVSDVNADPAGTARALDAAGADLIALEELVPEALPRYEKALAAHYPFHEVRGTVGIWSRYRLSGTRVVDIKPKDITEGWSRGLRTLAHTPHGEVAAYVAHLPSIRIGPGGLASARRDESARLLGNALAAEETHAVIVLGDLNATVDDRGLTPLTSRLNVPERGFAFSFPESFPLARIDQVMARGATVGRIHTLPATGSDHLPVTARVALD